MQISSSLTSDDYTAQASSTGNWLLVNGVTTIISGALPATLNVTVNPAGLAPGTYQGKVNITDADNGTTAVAVTLAIGGISTVANPSSLVFVAQAGEASPPPQTLEVSGTANATFTATVSAAWLSISSAGGAAPAQITVTANPTGLAAGTYNGSIAIDLDTHLQLVAVTLDVSATPVLDVSAGSFTILAAVRCPRR